MWEFVAAVLDKGKEVQWCDPVAAAHRLLHYNQSTKLILWAEDVQSTAQTWRSCCVHSTFCVHSTVQACACLGQQPCGTLNFPGCSGLLVRISAHVCICTWFTSAHKKLLLSSKLNWCTVFKSACIKNCVGPLPALL